jgi:ComF family protein
MYSSYWNDFLSLWFPDYCAGCEDILSTGEQVLCTQCLATVPLAHIGPDYDKPMRDLFFTRTTVSHLTTLFYYEKIGPVQHMLHELKYRGNEQVSVFLGRWLGSVLQETPQFQEIDLVVPVPIHSKRLQQRGYNQVSGFGKEIADSLGVRFRESVLKKHKNTIKQSQLNQQDRVAPQHSPFILNQNLEQGTHVLLVDDVITTGTTVVQCIHELQKTPGVRVSVATMALAI